MNDTAHAIEAGTMAAGQAVRVRRSFPPGHCRTPFYIKGCTGRIERAVGRFANPEFLAYDLGRAPQPMLYRVRFPMRSVWPDYGGPETDSVDVELYEHWLQPLSGDRPA